MTLDGSLIAFGSVLILPLSVIEGPLVSITVGFLSAAGYFDWAWALCLLVCGDLIGDLLYYAIGRAGKTRFTGLLRRFGGRRAVSPDIQRRLAQNATKMLFIGKWTHSIGLVVLIGSGMLRVNFLKFTLVNLIATLPKSAALFGIGYFAGNHYELVTQHLALVAILMGFVGCAAIVLVLWRSNAIRIGGAGQ